MTENHFYSISNAPCFPPSDFSPQQLWFWFFFSSALPSHSLNFLSFSLYNDLMLSLCFCSNYGYCVWKGKNTYCCCINMNFFLSLIRFLSFWHALLLFLLFWFYQKFHLLAALAVVYFHFFSVCVYSVDLFFRLLFCFHHNF